MFLYKNRAIEINIEKMYLYLYPLYIILNIYIYKHI